MTRWHAGVIGGLILLLTACAGAPVAPVADPSAAWERHTAELRELDEWRLTGRIAIQTGSEGWHATLDWRQFGEYYEIRIIAPLGQGSVLLSGDAERVILRTADDVIDASDPDRLLFETLGWRVPVAALRYWVLGLPAPGEDAYPELDAGGHLAELRQRGWRIQFQDYRQRAGHYTLPGKVFARSADGQVRLAIGEWRLEAGV